MNDKQPPPPRTAAGSRSFRWRGEGVGKTPVVQADHSE